MKKVLILFGTRPEAIKMAPLVKEFIKYPDKFETKICLTAQHREMLDQVMDFFSLRSDYDLDLMTPNQTLYTITAKIIKGLESVMEDFKPDIVFVHGDTTTSFAGGLAAFYAGAKIGHVEAGLRTFNKFAPFPEEINRSLVGRLADFHFAPTEKAKENLLKENVQQNHILVTGNTVIDALKISSGEVDQMDLKEIRGIKSKINWDKKIILVTGHRRENFGESFINIFLALKELANENVEIVYPVHLNPNVQKPVQEILKGIKNVHLIKPLSYPSFVWFIKSSYLIISDSGGIQEEAPYLGKPVLVLRDTTERPEAVEAGTVKLVGANKERIIKETRRLINDKEEYTRMSKAKNPFGDGAASQKIMDFISNISF